MSFRSAVAVSLVLLSPAIAAQEQPWCEEDPLAMPDPAPVWSDIKGKPDYVEVSNNFQVQQSLRLVISGLEKAITRLENGESAAADAEADGVCLCNCDKDASYWKDFVQTTLTTETQEALQKAQDQYIADVEAELDKTEETLYDAVPEFEEKVRGIIEESCEKLASCNGTVDDEAAKAVKEKFDALFGANLTLENLQKLRDDAKKLRDDTKKLLDKVSTPQSTALLSKENQEEVQRILDAAKQLYKDVAAALTDLRKVFQDNTVSQLVTEVETALSMKLDELVTNDEAVYDDMELAIQDAAQERIDAIRTAAESLYETAIDGEAVYDDFLEELESGLLDSISSVEGCYGMTKKRDCSIAAGKFCENTTELALFGDEDLALPLWLPTEVFKDGKSALRWAFSSIKWLELLEQNFDPAHASEAMKTLRAQLKNIDDVLDKINDFADTYTEGFHLGAYSTVRPDLHACVGYAGHGVLAEVVSAGGGDFRGGANYLSANLSRTHRSQFRAGGFALLINGRHLPLAPGVSLNLQMDGFRLWDSHHPFGLGAGQGDDWELHPTDLKDLDYFNLINEDDLDDVCCTTTKTDDCITCPITFSSLLHKGFYEVKYDANGMEKEWPREGREWEKDARIDAVFGAGLNLDLKMKTRYWSTTPIPVFPGASITPWLSLDAGAKWVYAANEFRDTLRKQINKGLPEESQLTDHDFGRDFHAFQAEDVTEDVGNGANVNPKLGADLNLGIDLSRWFKIGVTANLYLDVKVDASGTGGILDLNRALVDVIAESNPKGDDCKPILTKNEMRVCSNEPFKKKDDCANVPEADRKDCIDKSAKTPEGGLFSTGTYTCTDDELLCSEAKGYCVNGAGTIVAHDVTREQCEVIRAAPAGRCVAVYVEDPNGRGTVYEVPEHQLHFGPPLGLREENGTRARELEKAQAGADALPTEADCTGSGWCYNWGYLGEAEGRHFYSGVFIGIATSASACPPGVDRFGQPILGTGSSVASQFVPFQWQTSPPPAPDRRFFPYQCVKTYRPEITGYEGPDCNPLEFGYPSACAGESKPCSCDPANPDCPQGKTCVDGACLTMCSSDSACPEGQICEGGVCVMSSKIPFAEQVAWRLRNAAKPQHSIASYGLNRLITSVALGYGVRVGATLRLFRKEKVFSILDLSDAKPLFAYPFVKHQLGLEAQYQDDCDEIGNVKNHQEDLVKRYPDGGTSRQLLAWCRPEMAADEQNPEPMASVDEVVAGGVEATFDFAANIGVDFWNRAQFCIEGQPWDQYFASLKADPSKVWPRLSCTYKKNGITIPLDCSDAASLQSSLTVTLGCLDAAGPEAVTTNTALVQFLKSKGIEGNWLLPAPSIDVLDVRKIFADDAGTYTADNLDPLFVQQTAGFNLQPWLAGLDRCIGDPPLGRMNQDFLDVRFNLTAADLEACGGVCCIDGVCEPVTDQSLCKGQFLPVPECTPENGCMPTITAPPPRGACMLFGKCQEVVSAAHCVGGFFNPGKPCTEVPNLCREDRDCPADAWCRPTPEGSASCVPWQPESKFCGGFVEPSRRERCGPGLTCVSNPDLPVDAGGKCVRVCAPAPPAMAAWWPLDESIGSGSFDVLAQNDGTRVNTPAAIAGRVRGALRFDGIDDSLDIPDAVELDFGTADFSIALWLRMPAQSGVQSILDKRADGSGYHLYTYFGRPGLQLADGSYANYTAARAIDDGEWHHLAVTVDRDRKDGLRWYIDGQPAGSDDPTAHQLSINSTAPLRFGVRSISSDGWWEGDLDEPALFSRALTAAEIVSMHRAGGEGLCRCVSDKRRLEAWWTFDEDPRFGSHFGDYADNGNFGQSLNGTRSIEGVAGRALHFDGVDDYAEVSAPRVEVGSGDFSIDAWIAFFGITGTRVIAGKSSDTAGYELLVIDGRIALRLRSGGQTVLFDPGVHIAGQRWHHVAVTVRRDAKDGVRFYLDGVESGTRGDATLLPGSLASAVPFRIAAGSASVIPDAFWRGRIDELAVHGRVLAPAEIARLFRALTYGRCTPARPLAPPVVQDPFRPPVDELPIPRDRNRRAP